MPAPIIPWQPSNIPLEIQQELDRRKTVRSFAFIENQKANWDKGGDWSSYKGPMMPWVRVCSNSAGHPSINKPRFVFHGGKGFYQTYGFQPPGSSTDGMLKSVPGSNYQIIGYTPTNPSMAHIIENSLKNPTLSGKEQSNYPIHVPTPEISKITSTVQKELYRRAEIEWTCFSWEQLVYMTPYFLVPGISVMLEWGWNHFNPASLVKLDDENEMSKLWRNAYPLYMENVIKSRGNYDVLYGIITNFNWSMEGNKITCMTEITSKDRLYAGISKDMGLTINDDSNPNNARPIFQALINFISKDATLANLKAIAEEENPSKAISDLTDSNIPIVINTKDENTKNKSAGNKKALVKGAENQNQIWKDIVRSILSDPDPNTRGIKASYLRGIFTGRQQKFYNDPNGFGSPLKGDFDYSLAGKIDKNRFWINMGMIVEILNYFSTLDGGKGEPMFQVDILGSVIGGHPNMISCNRSVLIPNARAPKYIWGSIGTQNNGYDGEYGLQIAYGNPANSLADKTLRKVCQQYVFGNNIIGDGNSCYRNDLDKPINFLRRKYPSLLYKGMTNLGYEEKNYMTDFSFPAISDRNLPVSSTGLGKKSKSSSPKSPEGNYVEANVSGLLSNIYLSYAEFESIITDLDPKSASYVDIYRKILSVLNSSVDGFWDLILVEADNIMTIMDKNYIGTQNKDENPTYTFDYFDSDSIIKSLRFRPALTDAQATRAIYGEVNNPKSKYVYVDKNDLLDYKFRDAIVMNTQDGIRGEKNSYLDKNNTSVNQMNDILGEIQKLNIDENDDSLQMTIGNGIPINYGKGTLTGHFGSTSGADNIVSVGPFEYLKLCLPSSVSKQMFRLLIDDKDEGNNPRYCAVQPGITLELTIQGCGGLRTFQYFLVKNLPSPYSHRDIIFRIIDVRNIVSQEGNGWDTVITAGILPLRKYIKNRLTPPAQGWSEPTNTTT